MKLIQLLALWIAAGAVALGGEMLCWVLEYETFWGAVK